MGIRGMAPAPLQQHVLRALRRLTTRLSGGAHRRSLSQAEAEAVAGPLKLHPEEVLLLQQIPYRGQSSPMPPTDPLIYRFYEIVRAALRGAHPPTLSLTRR